MRPQPATTERLLAGPHNTRLGAAVHSFNIPAETDVCVGATPTCHDACYAKAFLFRLQRARHRRNYERSLRDDFPRAIAAEVRDAFARVVRIHAAGDFYDAAYADKWARVAGARPNTTFFAYTRSWRRPDVLDALVALARLGNVHLWFSEDRDTGPSPDVPRVRRAYLLDVGEPESSLPGGLDLVFRVPLPRPPGRPHSYERAAKRVGGVLVCPKEQGVARRVALTCSRCRVCFTAPGRRGRPRVAAEPPVTRSPPKGVLGEGATENHSPDRGDLRSPR